MFYKELEYLFEKLEGKRSEKLLLKERASPENWKLTLKSQSKYQSSQFSKLGAAAILGNLRISLQISQPVVEKLVILRR